MKKLIKATVLFAIATSTILTSCNNSSQKTKEEIKVGVLMSLTGSSATYGQATKKGIDLALEEINADSSSEYKFLLVTEDDKSVTIAASSIAEKSKVVLISPGSSNPNITNMGDYIFRNWISDIFEGNVMAEYLYNKGIRRASILYIKNDYGDGLNGVFSKRFTELGGTITSSNAFQQDATDFRTHLTKISSEKPEIIYLVGYYKEMAQILNQSTQLNIHYPVYSSVCFEDNELLKIAGKNAEGVIYTTPYFDINDSSGPFTNFKKSYFTKYNEEPDVYGAHGYDAMRIIADAINKNGNNADKVKNYLYALKDYHGVSGNTTFDLNGDVIKPVMLKIVKDRKFEILK
jgi:branched-chain amino acid transport system substrate-binding protein